jgi:hypothetical protein
MSHNLHQWLRRIKAVGREQAAARLGIDRLLAAARRDSTVLPEDLSVRDIEQTSDRLDGTYIIRLFAEFETGLRLFWPTARGTDPPGRTRDLLDGVAATRHIPHAQLMNAHAVREYRNTLVHEREEATTPFSIAEARGHLCWYFSFLPPKW